MGIDKSHKYYSATRKSKPLNNLPFELDLVSTSETVKYQRRQDKQRVKDFNKQVEAWCIEATSRLRVSVRAMVKNDSNLSASIQHNLYKEKGEVNRVGFSFAREGIYLHRGAGRGQGGFMGSSWIDQLGKKRTTNPDAFGKMNTGNRKAVRWFDPVIEKELPFLADIVAEYCADMAVDATRIFIEKN